MTRLVLYEDRHWRALRPLTDLAPVPALWLGAATLAERWRRAAALPLLAIEARGAAMAAWRDAPQPESLPAAGADEVLVLNAAVQPGPWLAAARTGRVPALWMGEGRVVGARLPFELLAPGLGRGEGFEKFVLGLGLPAQAVPDAPFLQHPWDLVARNADAIRADVAALPAGIQGDVHGAMLLEPERIAVAEGARVDALAVLDARDGPIYLDRGASVRSHTLVIGPCYVGPGTQLLGGVIARSSFGPECRIAGEVEECVWRGYANKRHHGFVGHSVIGAWANLGALTTTSDLKNNYGSVRVWVDGAEIDSGSSKVGAMIGDHVKTGIGTLLPTGASVGVAANLFGGGRFAPKRVASFAWWDGETSAEHELEKCVGTARIAMSRRGVTLSPADEAVLREAFAATAKERGG